MKIILYSDIHFGEKSNSEKHNQNCVDFIKFMYEYIDNNKIKVDQMLFLGDWHHNRAVLNIQTMKYSLQALNMINNRSEKTSMLLGNHDLFYKDRRDVHSLMFLKQFKNIEVISEPKFENNFLYLPWLLSNESLKDYIKEYNPTYVFGHFEIPTFLMDGRNCFGGEYNALDYIGPKMIFSGHFHSRDLKNNIMYIGSCFSHNFSDVNDYNRKGFAILDTETNEIEFVEWKEAPKYVMLPISKMNDIKFVPNMNIRLVNDVNLKQIEVERLQEELLNLPMVEDCLVILNNNIIINNDFCDEKLEQIEDLNTLVVELIQQVETQNIDVNELVNIYRSLEN